MRPPATNVGFRDAVLVSLVAVAIFQIVAIREALMAAAASDRLHLDDTAQIEGRSAHAADPLANIVLIEVHRWLSGRGGFRICVLPLPPISASEKRTRVALSSP